MPILRVLSLPTSRHHLAGSCRYQQREKNNQMETATNYDSWPRQRPRRRVDRSKRERLDDVFIPGLLWRAIPVRGREQDSKRAYLCSLLLHQARKFKDNCRSVAT
ncbi:unnamed protein product [Cochlearia groenlandica]